MRRALGATGDLLDLADRSPGTDIHAREAASTTLAWLTESVGGYLRMPRSFADGHALDGAHAPLLTLVDDLDLLGLTLDHTYDAVHRADESHLRTQLGVLRETFATRTDPRDLVQTAISPDHIESQVVQDRGLEVGEDGIPRLPVPEQPAPHHDSAHATSHDTSQDSSQDER
ncbi:hypothetical protein GCM10011366_09770 [Ornithinimicrobium tianjinense]|uniref:Uncharacterized protein n=1 Tax=Ornithinimicrobium tianjinense TaxID=1195761 RepID=A0A917F522_9MICO|nr:hypothetical protein GCM10011366_09770 [Ornithinimicrobium tianjinense]